MRKVKIYGTLGPACWDEKTLIQMFEEGMDGMRLNMSHMTLEEAAGIVETYHDAAGACGIDPELLIDMQGPELRIGRLDSPLQLNDGDRVSVDRLPLPKAVLDILEEQRQGAAEILLDDGKLLLRKEDRTTPGEPSACMLQVVRGGLLQSSKSIAIPGVNIKTPAMTEIDRINIGKAGAFGVTSVMQPFVRGKDDLIQVRTALDRAGCEDVRLLAKIENLDGVRKLDEIIPYCDEIVIARGDLGNAVELWELPAVQKQIAAVCRKEDRNFMVVTQMLDSMMERQVPTRAEVSDIFNAVLDGAASVMVTGETAVGKNPVQVIRYLSRTAKEVEKYCL